MAYYRGNNYYMQNPQKRQSDQSCQNNSSSASIETASCNSGCGNTEAAQNASCCILPQPPGYNRESLAIAYVPWQRFGELFDENKAFMVGTAFPALYKPFLAGGKC